MNHFKSYTEVVGMHDFNGGESLYGTSFTCKTCGKRAFKIKGSKSQPGPEAAKFMNNFKAYHSKHSKQCELDITSKEVSSGDDSEETPVLDPSKICEWTELDIFHGFQSIRNAEGEASCKLRVLDCAPLVRSRPGIQKWKCSFTNNYGTTTAYVGETLLNMFPDTKELKDEARSAHQDRVRREVVAKCVAAAVASVIHKNKSARTQKAEGKLKRVLEASSKTLYEDQPHPRLQSSTGPRPDRFLFRKFNCKKARGSKEPPRDERPREEDPLKRLDCIIAYITEPLSSDDATAIANEFLPTLEEPPTRGYSLLFNNLAQTFSGLKEKHGLSFLAKPQALYRWLAIVHMLSCATEKTVPITLAIAKNPPQNIGTNAFGFMLTDLVQLGYGEYNGLLCAVATADLVDKPSSAPGLQVLPLGYIYDSNRSVTI